MPSFDAVSQIEMHELDNALEQASKELAQRFDFRGTNSTIERADEGVILRSNSLDRIEAALTVFREKLAKRKVSMQSIDPQTAEPATQKSFRQLIKLKQGVDSDQAKAIVKALKERKLKVQAGIQGDQVRVTGKQRDDLQDAIAVLRAGDFGLPLQFINFRD